MKPETYSGDSAGAAAPSTGPMFSRLAGHYDLANGILSLGRSHFWRRALARRLKILDPPGRLLDLAAGTGDQIVAAKKLRPDLAVAGLDISPVMLELARPKIKRLPPPAPDLVLGDALRPPFPEAAFDSVSLTFGLRNIGRHEEVFRQVKRLLKPGGRFLILELFHNPRAPWAAASAIYLKHFMPLVGGLLGGRPLTRPDSSDYRYLASSIMDFPQPALIAAELAAAGFTEVVHHIYTFDAVMLVQGEKPAAARPAKLEA